MDNTDTFSSYDSKDHAFGGNWTLEKLAILEKYLNTFTTVLKKHFKLIYIDAFAGTGKLKLKHYDVTEYADGSVMRALKVTNKPFDKLFLIEKNANRYRELKQSLQDDRCEVLNTDFNTFIKDLKEDWGTTRGVLFLDPFGATVYWSTMKRIAEFEALDTWILHPTSAILRMLPRKKLPKSSWAEKLDKIFGGDGWRDLYRDDPQQKLIGEPDQIRAHADEISQLYKDKLRDLFGDRFLDKTYLLKYKNTVLFEFMFCVGSSSPNGIALAKRIANHILTKPQI